MKLITGLFRSARKKVMVKDGDMGTFREKITELVEKRDSFSDDGVAAKVEELKGMISDLPDGEGKEKLARYLEDFKAVKEQDMEAAKEAAKMVADLFEELDTAAMKDVPPTANKDGAGESGEGEQEKEQPAPEPAPKPADADKSKQDGEEKSNAEYTLEEIYQFIKKRMAEDCGSAGSAADNAPRIPVKLGGSPAGGIAEMFAEIKKGRD